MYYYTKPVFLYPKLLPSITSIKETKIATMKLEEEKWEYYKFLVLFSSAWIQIMMLLYFEQSVGNILYTFVLLFYIYMKAHLRVEIIIWLPQMSYAFGREVYLVDTIFTVFLFS